MSQYFPACISSQLQSDLAESRSSSLALAQVQHEQQLMVIRKEHEQLVQQAKQEIEELKQQIKQQVRACTDGRISTCHCFALVEALGIQHVMRQTDPFVCFWLLE